MKLIIPAHIGFGPAEDGQHVLIAPALGPKLMPIIIIPGTATNIEHGIDGGGTAQPFAARLIAGSAIQALLRNRIKAPIRVFGQKGKHARRNDTPAFIL